MDTQTDRIEKQIHLKAPRSRVWRALTDPRQFGEWFNAEVTGAFAEGAKPTLRMLYPGYEHLRFDIEIVTVRPEDLFVLRWHPYAVDTGRDYSSEPMTRVEFALEAQGEHETLLKLCESGFDLIPLDRRAEAFRKNTGGWEEQLENIQTYVTRS